MARARAPPAGMVGGPRQWGATDRTLLAVPAPRRTVTYGELRRCGKQTWNDDRPRTEGDPWAVFEGGGLRRRHPHRGCVRGTRGCDAAVATFPSGGHLPDPSARSASRSVCRARTGGARRGQQPADRLRAAVRTTGRPGDHLPPGRPVLVTGPVRGPCDPWRSALFGTNPASTPCDPTAVLTASGPPHIAGIARGYHAAGVRVWCRDPT